MQVIHPFEPVYDRNSKILVLGTIPSVKSREENFFYGHPQNRFWKMISCLTGRTLPTTIEQKKTLLLEERIGLWDVLHSCDIELSKDSSILHPVANDFTEILEITGITHIFTNGNKAQELYMRLCYPKTRIKSHALPSTSPANGRFTLEKLMWEWSVILKYLKKEETP
ncbi:MAG: DNA-deoxyinosine glycosylase [Clostridia bacterium]|nr:DNA-deoxyinosine glycosylase [Clostridia bacterium]